MNCSSVKIRVTPYATLAEFDDGCRLVMREGSCYEPDPDTYTRLRKVLGDGGTTRVIRDSTAIPIVMGIVTILSIALYARELNAAAREGGFLAAFLILLLNVVIHELGHAIALKIFLPQANVRVGFRLMFVFPTVYVNTSASYLLPRGKKVAVHLAGVFANALYLILIALFAPSLLWASGAVVGTVLMNLIPIMRGDGYHIIAALADKRRPSVEPGKEAIEDCIRGVAMLALLFALAELA